MKFRCRRCQNIIADLLNLRELENFVALIMHGKMALCCRECGHEVTIRDYIKTLVEVTTQRKALRGIRWDKRGRRVVRG